MAVFSVTTAPDERSIEPLRREHRALSAICDLPREQARALLLSARENGMDLSIAPALAAAQGSVAGLEALADIGQPLASPGPDAPPIFSPGGLRLEGRDLLWLASRSPVRGLAGELAQAAILSFLATHGADGWRELAEGDAPVPHAIEGWALHGREPLGSTLAERLAVEVRHVAVDALLRARAAPLASSEWERLLAAASFCFSLTGGELLLSDAQRAQGVCGFLERALSTSQGREAMRSVALARVARPYAPPSRDARWALSVASLAARGALEERSLLSWRKTSDDPEPAEELGGAQLVAWESSALWLFHAGHFAPRRLHADAFGTEPPKLAELFLPYFGFERGDLDPPDGQGALIQMILVASANGHAPDFFLAPRLEALILSGARAEAPPPAEDGSARLWASPWLAAFCATLFAPGSTVFRDAVAYVERAAPPSRADALAGLHAFALHARDFALSLATAAIAIRPPSRADESRFAREGSGALREWMSSCSGWLDVGDALWPEPTRAARAALVSRALSDPPPEAGLPAKVAAWAESVGLLADALAVSAREAFHAGPGAQETAPSRSPSRRL
jgi:hypothetical protein